MSADAASKLAAGDIVARAMPATPAGAPVAACPLQPDWVEIELLDDAGKPIPDKRYIITLPDGTQRQGKTDAFGIGAVRGFFADGAHGCEVSFPDLDDATWARESA